MSYKNNYTILYFFLILFIIEFFSATGSPLFSEEPFQTITFRLNLLTNTNRSTFHQYWDPRYGMEVIGEMPFYLGSVEGGLHLFSFNGKSADYPEFMSIYIFAGWGINISFGPDLRWYNGLRIGTYQMSFDDSEIHPTQVLESELGTGLSTRIDIGIYRRLNFHLGADYIVIFTHKKLEFAIVKTGISYTFDSPGWLKEFMK